MGLTAGTGGGDVPMPVTANIVVGVSGSLVAMLTTQDFAPVVVGVNVIDTAALSVKGGGSTVSTTFGTSKQVQSGVSAFETSVILSA